MLSTEKSGATLTVNPSLNAKTQMGKKKNPTLASLLSKRFRLVSGQTKTEERQKLEDGVPFFARSLTQSFLVLCCETARKRLLRRLQFS